MLKVWYNALMKLEKAYDIAEELLYSTGLRSKGWRFQFNKRKTYYGICYLDYKVIEISEVLTQLNGKRLFEDTVKHEIGHALCGHGFHNEEWASLVAELGGSISVTFDPTKINMPSPKYLAFCRKCKHEVEFYRKPRKEWFCNMCLYEKEKYYKMKVIEV